MGLYSGGLIIGRIFASDNWRGGGGGGGRLFPRGLIIMRGFLSEIVTFIGIVTYVMRVMLSISYFL